ncbi:hypothetical protein KAFR_0C00490 [Kazachstania africana CBS 2517]|uniref:C2H2-type domain-containing protein n=1 Tax=Kazachstania africana (strain ATCC 22294 / BCRC 22015 / CBS 2517 / CECT 1963 / NBRC 1671 / NRRL Y-8276) TaxID=1071382 RepID=H2ARP4_KAZAF|nr:hypothetical protein KAFR_0C00490 [Kazachstania africana CBS 2517]CCF57044.1 hypothetical protein KAFR_0C00490 [Kazachstania africana CBS 2517]
MSISPINATHSLPVLAPVTFPLPNIYSRLEKNIQITISYNDPSYSLKPQKKYQTLIPLVTNSHMIENDLKTLLNKHMFDTNRNGTLSASSSRPNIVPGNKVPLNLMRISGTSPLFNKRKSEELKHQGIEKQPIVMKLSSFDRNVQRRKNISINKQRKHVCKVCTMAFTTSGHLSRHNKIHTGEKKYVCPFEGCGQRFSRHDNCVQHHKTHLRKKENSKSKSTSI